MEVLCERCQTEYDFDDALVSDRGTTVKCTSCGHQFRIYRPRTMPGAPEKWAVRTRAGHDLVFTSLRDLQRAITRGVVGRADTLVRDGLPARVLSSIAELEPFFPPSASVPPPPRVAVASERPRERRPTPRGLGSTPPPPVRVPAAARAPTGHEPTLPAIRPPAPQELDWPDEATHPNEPSVAAAPPRPSSRAAEALGEEPGYEPATVRKPASAPPLRSPAPALGPPPRARSEPPPPRPGAPAEAPLQGRPELAPSSWPSSRGAPASDVLIRQRPDPVLTPTPSDVRASYGPSEVRASHGASDDAVPDIRFLSAPPKRSAAARWVVALVVLGALAVVAATVGRRWIVAGAQSASSGASGDERVADYLRRGDKQLLEGDLDGAKESFDKASALAERDPRVLVQLARWAAVRADFAWLKVRLLGAEQADALAVTRAELAERSKRATLAAGRAGEAAPGDAAAVRARIDALRLAGDVAAARKLVPQIAPGASSPETAYVLAALDMSEAAPSWGTVIERLRVAASGEQSLGRARGALVYALASAGQADAALAELGTLSRGAPAHPLLAELKQFVARAPAGRRDGGVAGLDGAVAAMDPSALPVATAPPAAGRVEGAGEGVPGDYQETLRQAHAAKESGALERAEQLFRSVLAKNPGDSEALAGLGDVARLRGDKGGSATYYEQVTKQNPSYLPALIGLADAKWEAGDKAGAVALYRQVLDKVGGQGAYATRARQRIAAATQAGTSEPAPSSTAGKAHPTATATSQNPSVPPGVDTSDLPGWKP